MNALTLARVGFLGSLSLLPLVSQGMGGRHGRGPDRGGPDRGGPGTGEEPPGAMVLESEVCARCHSGSPDANAMRDASDRIVAPYDLWRGTMMANAARDPLWRAVVSAEIAATPSRRTEIEETCLSCHAPMAHRVGLESHETDSLMHVLDCDSKLGELARDGVSCTVCHGMSPDGLGTPESFTAGFHLDGWRRMFGPHKEPFVHPMQPQTGFTPTYGEHITTSALCGTCHTLETEVLDADGEKPGLVFLEQAPYLEWLNSDYRDVEVGDAAPGASPATCQDCHARTTDVDGRPIRTTIARNPAGLDFPATRPREPFGRHLFVGGNTLVLGMLRDHGPELGTTAPPAAFQASIDETRRQLSERTANVAIADVERAAGRIAFAVDIENRTGHKLPTAHPTRRVWLRAIVRDGDGAVVFASGAFDGEGRIVDADGAPLASELAGGPIEPHRDVVRSADEVASYRAVMADREGAPTHTLLRGARWYVDDRLLPRGWSPTGPSAARTAPVGTADDGTFVAGGDRVTFDVPVPTSGDLSIEVTLLHQSLSARWAAELFEWKTPEVARFAELYRQADRTPEPIATARWSE